MGRYCKLISGAIFSLYILIGQAWAQDDLWQITFYCSCERCNGRWPGVTATGHDLDDGVVACNILPLGTIIHVEGFGYKVVMDRGAKKYFGGRNHIDVYVNDHEKAKRLGVLWRKVKVISMGPSDGGWEAKVGRVHFVSDIRFKNACFLFLLVGVKNGHFKHKIGAKRGVTVGNEWV